MLLKDPLGSYVEPGLWIEVGTTEEDTAAMWVRPRYGLGLVTEVEEGEIWGAGGRKPLLGLLCWTIGLEDAAQLTPPGWCQLHLGRPQVDFL